MPRPEVDLVIAVHNADRPVDRAVRSVLAGTSADVRVTVVCHNTPRSGVEERLSEAMSDARLRVVTFDDGVASPSGPFNHGLDLADAPFTSIMGSDDELEPGAIDSWLRLQREHRSDFVIARLRTSTGRPIASPPARPLRQRRLDGLKDRLAYRSAPLGLLSRERFGAVRLEAGMRNGGDNVFVAQLWFAGANISFDRRGPAYLIHDDAGDRVTMAPKPIADELAWVPVMLGHPVVRSASVDVRRAIGRKVARVHVLGALRNRRTRSGWYEVDRDALVAVLSDLDRAAPGYRAALSIADARTLGAVEDPTIDEARLKAIERRRTRFDASAMVASTVRGSLARDAPIRMMLAAFAAGGLERVRGAGR